MKELRCDNAILHGILIEDRLVEFKCRSKRCGAADGVVVLHRFDKETGELTETLRFRDPLTRREEVGDGTSRQPVAVRHP